MDMPPEYSSSSGRSPRRELQGPRPAPLKVRKDSHKIRKPPMAPPPVAGAQAHHAAAAPPRPPVIIYTVSPKIIHANPNEFMSLVQRLTGPNASKSPSTSATSAAAAFFQESSAGGAVSPAARFASIEKTRSPEGRKSVHQGFEEGFEGMDIGITDSDNIVQRTGQYPGILSPNPNTLAPIPPNFFSPPSDSFNPLSFFHDLSPVLHSSRNYLENNNSNNNNNNNNNTFILPSPSANFFSVSPNINYMPSPNTLDLFHSLFDI